MILRCWEFYWVCMVATPNTSVFFACGTAELMESTTRRSIGLQEKNQGQEGRMSSRSYLWAGKILLRPLHIKLGLLKQFVKALDFKGETFQGIRAMVPKLSDPKLKSGKFAGRQIPCWSKESWGKNDRNRKEVLASVSRCGWSLFEKE